MATWAFIPGGAGSIPAGVTVRWGSQAAHLPLKETAPVQIRYGLRMEPSRPDQPGGTLPRATAALPARVEPWGGTMLTGVIGSTAESGSADLGSTPG